MKKLPKKMKSKKRDDYEDDDEDSSPRKSPSKSLPKLSRSEQMKKTLKKLSSGSDFFKFPPNETTSLRILPPGMGTEVDTEGGFYFDAGYHYNMGPEGKSFCCPKATFDGECPICEEAARRAQSQDAGDIGVARKLRPQVRAFLNSYVKGHGFSIVPIGKTILDELIKYSMDSECVEDGELDDVEHGKWVKVEREGTKMDTDYSVRIPGKSVPLSSLVDDVDELLEQRKALASIPKAMTYGELEEILEETPLDAWAEKAREEAKSKSKKKGKKDKKKGRDD
jgi:hypothetical protein